MVESVSFLEFLVFEPEGRGFEPAARPSPPTPLLPLCPWARHLTHFAYKERGSNVRCMPWCVYVYSLKLKFPHCGTNKGPSSFFANNMSICFKSQKCFVWRWLMDLTQSRTPQQLHSWGNNRCRLSVWGLGEVIAKYCCNKLKGLIVRESYWFEDTSQYIIQYIFFVLVLHLLSHVEKQ